MEDEHWQALCATLSNPHTEPIGSFHWHKGTQKKKKMKEIRLCWLGVKQLSQSTSTTKYSKILRQTKRKELITQSQYRMKRREWSMIYGGKPNDSELKKPCTSVYVRTLSITIMIYFLTAQMSFLWLCCWLIPTSSLYDGKNSSFSC